MIKECAHQPCAKPFEAKRADARFCSASCRAAASRARRVKPRSPAPTLPLVPSPISKTPEAPRSKHADRRIQRLESALVELRDGLKHLGDQVRVLSRRQDVAQGRINKELGAVAARLREGRPEQGRVPKLEARLATLERTVASASPTRTPSSPAHERRRIARLESDLAAALQLLRELQQRVEDVDQAAAVAIAFAGGLE